MKQWLHVPRMHRRNRSHDKPFKTDTNLELVWNSHGTYPESIIEMQGVELVNVEHLKYSVWISYKSLVK